MVERGGSESDERGEAAGQRLGGHIQGEIGEDRGIKFRSTRIFGIDLVALHEGHGEETGVGGNADRVRYA